MMPTNANYFVPLATKILRAAGGALDAATFHVYSFCDGNRPASSSIKETSKVKFFDKQAMALPAESVRMMRAVVANTTLPPSFPIWLSETNSICSGGVANLSNTYANTPWLFNQLGLLARMGVPVMAQQTLIGSDYGLLSGHGDRLQNASLQWEAQVTARPNFFANILHRRLTAAPGSDSMMTVLNASIDSESAAVYAYCASATASDLVSLPGSVFGGAGSVVFVLLNLDPNQTLTFQLSVPPPTAFASSVVRSGDQQATGTKQQQNDGARVAAPQLSVWELYGQVR